MVRYILPRIGVYRKNVIMKKSKMKKSSGIITGLLAGAAVGALTFLYVKPKLTTKKKEQVSANLPFSDTVKAKPENLFI